MPAVDPLFAQWLQAGADHAVRTDAAIAARWGSTAATTEQVTGIATRAGAIVEADRQLQFFARGPFAEEVHRLTGTDWAAQLGLVVTLTIAQLGYDGGVDVLVLGVEVDRDAGMSQVTVLRPLKPA